MTCPIQCCLFLDFEEKHSIWVLIFLKECFLAIPKKLLRFMKLLVVMIKKKKKEKRKSI